MKEYHYNVPKKFPSVKKLHGDKTHRVHKIKKLKFNMLQIYDKEAMKSKQLSPFRAVIQTYRDKSCPR